MILTNYSFTIKTKKNSRLNVPQYEYISIKIILKLPGSNIKALYFLSCNWRNSVFILILFRTFCLRLENNDTLKCISKKIPKLPHISALWKIFRTTFQSIIVLKSQQEGPEKYHCPRQGTDPKQYYSLMHTGPQSVT